MVRARIAAAVVSASAALAASLTPPAFPRPPTKTWALMTTWGTPEAKRRSAMARAPAAVVATSASGTGRLARARSSRASASWIFTLASYRSLVANSAQHTRAGAGRRG